MRQEDVTDQLLLPAEMVTVVLLLEEMEAMEPVTVQAQAEPLSRLAQQQSRR